MTLTYELGLDILKVYLHTKNEVSRSRLSKVRARTGQTHRQTDRHTDWPTRPKVVPSASRVVIICDRERTRYEQICIGWLLHCHQLPFTIQYTKMIDNCTTSPVISLFPFSSSFPSPWMDSGYVLRGGTFPFTPFFIPFFVVPPSCPSLTCPQCLPLPGPVLFLLTETEISNKLKITGS